MNVATRMAARYLFRFDGSRENDEFFAAYSSIDPCVAYAGTPMQVGPGWIPDFLEVGSPDGGRNFTVVVIELEATSRVAKESSRKYLPEDPSLIIERFKAYLETVLTQCRATADPRLNELEKLLAFLSTAERIEVFTAAGLRDSLDFVEKLPLRQLIAASQMSSGATRFAPAQRLEARGQHILSREEADCLKRVIRILNAIITGHDESGAKYKGWRNVRERPLEKAAAHRLRENGELNRLLRKPKHRGLRVDFDRLVDELSSLWSDAAQSQTSSDQIRASIGDLFPLAESIREHTPMREVFRQAHLIFSANIH